MVLGVFFVVERFGADLDAVLDPDMVAALSCLAAFEDLDGIVEHRPAMDVTAREENIATTATQRQQ